MSIDALPIVARELRVASRRKGVYRLRFGAGVLTLLLGSYFLVLGDNVAGTVPAGRILFLIVSFLLFIAALAAAHETYDSISAEKREGTIGFLFLTELYPHDIVLGKVFAAALPSFYAMVATFPLLASAAMMGGVTGGEIWQTWLALMNLFFFAQAAAILASALFRERAHAAAGALLLIGGFTLGAAAWSASARHPSWLWKAFNPAYDFALATQTFSARGSLGDYWISAGAVNVMAWVFLGVASLALPRTWYEKPAQPGFARETGAAPSVKLTSRPAKIGAQPFVWLASRTTGGPVALWRVWGTITAAIIFGLSLRRTSQAWTTAIALMASHTLLKYWMAAAASRSTEEQRRDGLFEILLGCTPLKESDLLEGQRVALRRLFVGPAAALAAVDIFLALVSGDSVTRAFLFGAAVQLPIDLLALGWVAMWFAVSQKKPRRAAASAYILVCVAPTIVMSVPLGVGLQSGTGIFSTALVWVIVGVSADVTALFLARQKLRLFLRAMSSGAPEKARQIRLFAEPIEALAG